MRTDNEGKMRLKELDHRAGDGIEVSLLWSPESNELAVLVVDTPGGEEFALEISAEEALDAFRHPYAYRGARRTTFQRVLKARAA